MKRQATYEEEEEEEGKVPPVGFQLTGLEPAYEPPSVSMHYTYCLTADEKQRSWSSGTRTPQLSPHNSDSGRT